MAKRRQFSSQFKAKVALEALRGELTVAQIATKCDVHPNMIAGWKRRLFKHVLGCRHLLSHRANGIEIQVYCAIIVSMLIALWTGRKPTLRTMEMLRFYFIGWANAEEVEAHIAKLQPLNG
jgi:hypothetical protein